MVVAAGKPVERKCKAVAFNNKVSPLPSSLGLSLVLAWLSPLPLWGSKVGAIRKIRLLQFEKALRGLERASAYHLVWVEEGERD